ncbi:MAG: hypothetical protein AAGI01_15960 [Myxococcota bacterium]
MAIYPATNDTQTQWGKGGFGAMLMRPGITDAFGFCDGIEEDEQELLAQAEMEGAEVRIDKKALKSGREVWTVHTLSTM